MTATRLTNYEEADRYRRGITNAVTQELVGLALGVLVRRWLQGDKAVVDFDALYFVQTVEEALSEHEILAAVLRGESILWPEEGSS